MRRNGDGAEARPLPARCAGNKIKTRIIDSSEAKCSKEEYSCSGFEVYV
jgi:hypothetical protein